MAKKKEIKPDRIRRCLTCGEPYSDEITHFFYLCKAMTDLSEKYTRLTMQMLSKKYGTTEWAQSRWKMNSTQRYPNDEERFLLFFDLPPEVRKIPREVKQQVFNGLLEIHGIAHQYKRDGIFQPDPKATILKFRDKIIKLDNIHPGSAPKGIVRKMLEEEGFITYEDTPKNIEKIRTGTSPKEFKNEIALCTIREEVLTYAQRCFQQYIDNKCMRIDLNKVATRDRILARIHSTRKQYQDHKERHPSCNQDCEEHRHSKLMYTEFRKKIDQIYNDHKTRSFSEFIDEAGLYEPIYTIMKEKQERFYGIKITDPIDTVLTRL